MNHAKAKAKAYKKASNVIPMMKPSPRLLGVFGLVRKTSGEVVELNGSAHSVHLYLECLHDVDAILTNNPQQPARLFLEFSDGTEHSLRFDHKTKQMVKVVRK